MIVGEGQTKKVTEDRRSETQRKESLTNLRKTKVVQPIHLVQLLCQSRKNKKNRRKPTPKKAPLGYQKTQKDIL